MTTKRVRELRIEGSRIDGIHGLYAELNRLLMADEDWELGESLDALNDALYGGFGAMRTDDRVRFVWADHQHSRAALGREATEAWLRGKLAHPAHFDRAGITQQLDELLAGRGKTYWDIVLEVFADHPVELVLA